MPNTTNFVLGTDKIINDDIAMIPKLALRRFQEVGAKIEAAMALVIPSILKDVQDGREQFRMNADRISNQTEALISNIQLKTVRSTRSFDDVYEKFGNDRSIMNSLVCGCLFVVSI